MVGYERTYVYDNVFTHPTQDCVIFSGEAAESRNCAYTSQPTFVEAADYTNGERGSLRIVAARYESEAAAFAATREMLTFSREVGRLGNYGVVEDLLTVQHFYAFSGTSRLVTWSHGDWVFMVAGDSLPDVERIVERFPY